MTRGGGVGDTNGASVGVDGVVRGVVVCVFRDCGGGGEAGAGTGFARGVVGFAGDGVFGVGAGTCGLEMADGRNGPDDELGSGGSGTCICTVALGFGVVRCRRPTL